MSTLPALVDGPPASVSAQRPARAGSAAAPGGRAVRQPRRRGRPTRLTPELAQQLVTIVAQVGFLSTAARVCGVPPSLVCEWVARGLGRDPDRRPTRLYAEFADAVERARGQFELDRLRSINAAAKIQHVSSPGKTGIVLLKKSGLGRRTR